MTNENYITIQGWMIKSLHLKGNELLTYAIIFGFSQDKEHWFKGSSKYLEEALQCSRRNAVNVLSSLVQKGLLEKKQESIEGIVFNRYRCVLDSSYTYAESSQGVYEKSAHSNNSKGNNEKEYEINSSSKDSLFLSKKDEKNTRFVPPTLEEVQAYCLEKNYTIDPEAFIAFYESKGWYVGKNKMKNWKAAVVTFEKNKAERKKQAFRGFRAVDRDYQEMPVNEERIDF